MGAEPATLPFSSFMSKHGEELRRLLEERSLLPGPIPLSNGQVSDFYFDCKRVTLSSDGAPLVGDAFLSVLEALPDKPDAVGGLTHGADPIVTAIQMQGMNRGLRYEGFYVRKQPKKHGTRQWVENVPPPGTKVAIVDDVVTTGGSVVTAIQHAEEEGCKVVAVICLVDRGEGGSETIKRVNPNYFRIYPIEDFAPALAGMRASGKRSGRLSSEPR